MKWNSMEAYLYHILINIIYVDDTYIYVYVIILDVEESISYYRTVSLSELGYSGL